MKRYRLIGEVEVKKDFTELAYVKHTEVIEAADDASRSDLIDESLEGGVFTEEQEPTWDLGFPLILPEPEPSMIAGEEELRAKVLLEALPYLEKAYEDRFGCESIGYVTGVTTSALNGRDIRVTPREVRQFLAEAGYPTHRP